MSTTEANAGDVDRDRLDRIAGYVRGKLDGATAALDAEDPGKAGILLREGYYLLDIAADLAGAPAEAEIPGGRDVKQVDRWEHGKDFPCRADRQAIAQALDVPEENLFMDDPD